MNIPFWVPWVISAIVLGVLEWRRRARVERAAAVPRRVDPMVVALRDEPDGPLGFGRKSAWVAVRAPGAAEVSAALGLVESRPANWHSGLEAAHADPSDCVFVTPPVRGWVLATGAGLPDPGDPARLREWRRMMAELSTRFGDAQYFATHRVSNYSAWARYSHGTERRLFAHADDPIHDLGEPLPEEADLMAHLPDLAAAENDPASWDREDLRTPDEDDVLRLAAAWSLDPTELDDPELPPSVGSVGRRIRGAPRSAP